MRYFSFVVESSRSLTTLRYVDGRPGCDDVKAVNRKLPLVMQNLMSSMQQCMLTVAPKIQLMAQEAATQIKAQNEAAADGNTG